MLNICIRTLSINWWELEIEVCICIYNTWVVLGRLLHSIYSASKLYWHCNQMVELMLRFRANIIGKQSTIGLLMNDLRMASLIVRFNDKTMRTKGTNHSFCVFFYVRCVNASVCPLSLFLFLCSSISINVAWKCQLWEISMCQYNEWKFHFLYFTRAMCSMAFGSAHTHTHTPIDRFMQTKLQTARFQADCCTSNDVHMQATRTHLHYIHTGDGMYINETYISKNHVKMSTHFRQLEYLIVTYCFWFNFN